MMSRDQDQPRKHIHTTSDHRDPTLAARGWATRPVGYAIAAVASIHGPDRCAHGTGQFTSNSTGFPSSRLASIGARS